MLYETKDMTGYVIAILAPLLLLPTFWKIGERNSRKENKKEKAKPCSKERVGEKMKWFLESAFKKPVLYNAIFQTDSSLTTKTNIVQVNKKGIFVVKCKYQDGNISGLAKSNLWDVSNKTKQTTMKNTVKQNFYQIKEMKKYLEDHGINTKEIPMYNISMIFGEGLRDQAKDATNKNIRIYSKWEELEELKDLPDLLDESHIKRLHELLKHKVVKQ